MLKHNRYMYYMCIRFNERNKNDIKVLDHEFLEIPDVNKQTLELFIVFKYISCESIISTPINILFTRKYA